MATETADRRAAHRRSLAVTATACIAGVVAGVLSQAYATGPSDLMGPVFVLASIPAVLLVCRLLGVDVEDFSPKDHLYVGFMTFTLWFVSWTVLLTTGVPL